MKSNTDTVKITPHNIAFKNLKVSTQLTMSFFTIFVSVIVLGTISYIQSNHIHKQTEILYKHPLQVRSAIGELKSDILIIQRNMKDLFLVKNEEQISFNLSQIEIYQSKIFGQIEILYKHYLGPHTDIDLVKKEIITWNSMRQETIRLLRAGKIQEAATRTSSEGLLGKQAEVVLNALAIIDNFAKNKGESLFVASEELVVTLKGQLLLLVGLILLLSLFIFYNLLQSIRNPLNELTDATKRFYQGERSVRSSYTSENEFGILSSSFNTMVDGIQANAELSEKVTSLASLMLSEYDVKKFFQSTLHALAMHTGSQMAAIYLLSKDKKTFEHFESIGIDANARQTFAADHYEGEFGSVLSSHKVQYVKNIPKDTRFTFNTVSGKFIPNEIITLPILANNEVVAIISLATVSNYNAQSIQLVERILITLCARVEGILAYHKMKEFLEMLELQNRELETQKKEMESQASELVQQNTELEIQKQQLNEVSQLKTSFLSNMSHELRTPLNSVIALSGVLNRRLAKKIPEEEYSYLEVIERNGKHLLNLINDILDISRIEAGREEIEVTKFNINSLLSDLVNMINPQAEQKNIALVFLKKEDHFISSDVDKCQHILQNLIGNAVKFTEKGTVQVTVEHTTESILVKVTDTGIGIPKSYIQTIFEEFRQADNSTSRRYGGSGLGLAIAKKYANLLGGTITVKSTLGNGSEFTLHLPINYSVNNENNEQDNQSIPKHSIQRVDDKQPNDLLTKTILLVEDNEPIIIQMKDFLEESGYRILIAHGGNEALEIIANIIPDGIILDLMMPVVDGFEVLRKIREAEPTSHIPVLILTAKHITKEELTFLKRNNIHQLIQKGSINRKDLLDAIATMLFSFIEEPHQSQMEVQVIDGKPVILIVEDNADNMTTVKAILSNRFTLIEAVDGYKGIEQAKKYLPHLILMDIQLPGINGIEAFKKIRSSLELQNIPIIALTASAMLSERETILAHGFNGYVTKPIDEKTLLKAIGESLYGK